MRALGTAVLLGGALGDVPLVGELHRAGLRVVSVGGDPFGAAHREADEHVLVDFSDPEACTAVARDRRAVAVIPGSNDFAAISAAIVADRLGLPGHDPVRVVRELNLKQLFRAVQAEIGLPHPAFRIVEASNLSTELADPMRLPVLVKPTDLTGGKGIRMVERWVDVRLAVEQAQSHSRSDDVLIEEFLPGTRHGVTALVVDGRIDFRFFDDEQYESGGFRVVGAISPSSLGVLEQTLVVEQLDALVDRLELSDGLLHAQLVAGPDGPVLIEATRRLPGDLYARFVEVASRFPYTRAVVAPYLRDPVPVITSKEGQRPISRWVVVSDRPGTYQGLEIAPQLRTAILETHHAVDPQGGIVSRTGLTLTVLIIDLERLTKDAIFWRPSLERLAVPVIVP